jgi:exopolysaccharide production protein ExoQ
MLKYTFSVAFMLQFISLNVDAQSLAQIIQLSAVLLICGHILIEAAFQYKTDSISLIPTNFSGLLIAIIAPFLSIISLLVSENNWIDGAGLIVQSMLLCVTALSIRLLINRKPFEFFAAALISFFFLSILVVAVDFENLWMALTLETTDTGRVRFSPFNNHPNLVAHVFASGIILTFVSYIYDINLLRRKIYLFFIGLQVVIVIATSSRGAMVAIVPAIIFVMLHVYGSKFIFNRQVFALCLIFLVWLLASSFGRQTSTITAGEWLLDIFEVNSEYRGLDSGGSGRLELWPIVLEKASATIQSTLIGNGYRSWSIEHFGFSIDNSYINLFWEFGFVVALTLILVLLRQCWLIAASPRSIISTGALGVLVFILVDSIFARYLIGIGNATSLLALSFFLLERETLQRCGVTPATSDDCQLSDNEAMSSSMGYKINR